MTPQDFVNEVEAFSQCGNPDGLLEYATAHLADVTPHLNLEQTIRVNELGEWAAMVVSMREFSERMTSATTAR